MKHLMAVVSAPVATILRWLLALVASLLIGGGVAAFASAPTPGPVRRAALDPPNLGEVAASVGGSLARAEEALDRLLGSPEWDIATPEERAVAGRVKRILEQTRLEADAILKRATPAASQAAPAIGHALRVVAQGTGEARSILKDYVKGYGPAPRAAGASSVSAQIDLQRRNALAELREARDRFRVIDREERRAQEHETVRPGVIERGEKLVPIGRPCG
ncbi:MAG TPA: hypothetical protein VFT43_08090 [Candidatus Polarisedimenticolia bacterium]|nr:hypothetical protein [Candidatus Polarisedimenticolia bacterium]